MTGPFTNSRTVAAVLARMYDFDLAEVAWSRRDVEGTRPGRGLERRVRDLERRMGT